MKYRQAVIITGPNTAGKTSVAYELARIVGVGEVINMDRTFIFKNFPISTGLSDIFKEKDVPRHLYEVLNPDEVIWNAEEYAAKTTALARDILERGGLPIIEGGSPKYLAGLHQINTRERNLYHPIVGIKYSCHISLEEKIRQRMDNMFYDGLIDEVNRGLEMGYKDTKVMREVKAIVPIVKYLRHEITLNDARVEMLTGALKLSEYQLSMFMQYPDIIWIENNSRNETVAKIIELIDSG